MMKLISGTACLLCLLAGSADEDKPKDPRPDGKPSTERREVGKFTSKGESLVRRGKDGDWVSVPAGGIVRTAEPLLSLPGNRSDLRLNSGVNLRLWGALPELQLPFPLLESAVTLHHAPRGLDADLTLQRGRIYLSNSKEKGPVRVRLRFWRGETWDVTLDEPGTVVGAELFSGYPPDTKFSTGEEPVVAFVLYVAKGSTGVKVGFHTFTDLKPPPGRGFFYWNNKGKLEGPIRQDKPLAAWDQDQRLPREFRELAAAREKLAARLAKSGKNVEVGLLEALASDKPADRAVAVRGLAAVDRLDDLVDALGDETHPDVRREAFVALRNWIGRGEEQVAKLYDPKKRTGILVDKKYRADEAESVLELLDGLPPQALKQPETYEALIAYLKHGRLAVRGLAYRHLLALVPAGRKIKYDPAGDREQIEQGYKEWKKLIPSGKLPPAPPPPKPGGDR